MGKLLASVSGWRRCIAFTAALAVTGGLAAYGGIAGAAPQPTVDQVQARINQLTSQFDNVSEQFDQASQQLSAARSRLSQVRVHLNHATTQYQAAQASLAQTAAAAFEDTGATSIAGVLTSGDPSMVLQQGSPEVSTPAIEVAPVPSKAAAAACAALACWAWNWALA